jgi:hypothetical protein
MAELMVDGQARAVDISIFDPARFAADALIQAPHEYADG